MKTAKQTKTLAAAVIAIAILSVATTAGADETNESKTTVKARAEVGERPPFYFNFMLAGSAIHEDSDARLTSYDRTGLFHLGLALRMGGVVNDNHLIGGIFQGNWRSTEKVLDSQGGDNEWGAVSNWYLGPEYRYQFDFGLYAGASVGFSYIFADNDINGGE